MIDIEIGRTVTGGRTFPVAFRIEFVQRWDACTGRGAKTRLLREHNLTHPTVRNWLKGVAGPSGAETALGACRDDGTLLSEAF